MLLWTWCTAVLFLNCEIYGPWGKGWGFLFGWGGGCGDKCGSLGYRITWVTQVTYYRHIKGNLLLLLVHCMLVEKNICMLYALFIKLNVLHFCMMVREVWRFIPRRKIIRALHENGNKSSYLPNIYAINLFYRTTNVNKN